VEVPAEPLEVPVQTVSRDVAARVHEMLVTNVHQGFAKQAQIAGLETGGMGSTAYIAKGGTYVEEYHSNFFGFANDGAGRKFTIGVLVIRPKDRYSFYASRSAVPVFRSVVTVMVEHSFLIPKEVTYADTVK
jgi:cell division protein FtsI (penicillin-binding protein 3)